MSLAVLKGLLRSTLLRLRGEDGSDAGLLSRFVGQHDQDAFAEMVRRHGPMVLQVCHRVLGHAQDAEDAYQATFIVLARRAGSVSPPESLGGWLHGVAYRTALNVRKTRSRRKPIQLGEGVDVVARERTGRGELREVLDAELDRLPQKYRVLLVLCALEGRPLEEAAATTGRPVGTVKRHLFEARDLLRQRLIRRGLTCAPAALTGLLAPVAASAAAVPRLLEAAVVQGALQVAAGQAPSAGGLSAEAVALAEATLPGALGGKGKLAVVLLATGLILGGMTVSAIVLLGNFSRSAPTINDVIQVYRGRILTVVGDQLTVKLGGENSDRTFTVATNARITVGGKSVRLPDLPQGLYVTLTVKDNTVIDITRAFGGG